MPALTPATLDHVWIARHIPHQGTMCLLEQVDAWDQQHIECRAISHRSPTHPLRAHGRLGSACGIEYAAQAMALHGALLAPPDSARPRAGFLVSARGTRLYVARLDDISADLQVVATCITRSGDNILYEFSVSAANRPLLTGRAAIVTNADALTAGTGIAA